MKAAVVDGLSHISIQNIPKPTCDDDSAVLKVKACAVLWI